MLGGGIKKFTCTSKISRQEANTQKTGISSANSRECDVADAAAEMHQQVLCKCCYSNFKMPEYKPSAMTNWVRSSSAKRKV